MTTQPQSSEETFDPSTPEEWEAFRALAHRMVDDMLSYLTTLRDRPAWREMPLAVRGALSEPIPYEGIGAEAAYAEFVQNVLPYPDGNLHPRFFGWVKGNGTPLGMMADMLAAGLNPHMAGFNQAPALVEQQLIDWLATLLGMSRSTVTRSIALLTQVGWIDPVRIKDNGRGYKLGFALEREASKRPEEVYWADNWIEETTQRLPERLRGWRHAQVRERAQVMHELLQAIIDVDGINPVALAAADHVVITVDAVKKVEEWLA